MDLVVSVENATTLTPELSVVQVDRAAWLPTQQLSVGDPIGAGRRVVGMLEGDPPFEGRLVVHYGFLPPGPGSADVTITFDVSLLDGRPLVGFGDRQVPGNAFPATQVEVGDDHGTKVLLARIAAQ